MGESTDVVLKQSNLLPSKIHDVFMDPRKRKILYGGRASLKSGSIARYIVLFLFAYMQADKPANAVVVRKLKEDLRSTVFSEFEQAIMAMGLSPYFKISYSPLMISCGNNRIIFKGANGPDKNLKGVALEHIKFLWLEEADQLDDIRHVNDIIATFARNFTPDYNVIVSFNPPDNAYHWIFSLLKNKNYAVQKLTYLDDDKGFLNSELLEVINELKESDFELYKQIYLGEMEDKGKKYFRHCLKHDRANSPKDYVFAGVDASTTGDDKTRLSILRYNVDDRVMYHQKFVELNTQNWVDGKTIFENIAKIEQELINNRVGLVLVDRGGGGQGIVDELTREEKPFGVVGVYFGSKAVDKTRSITFNNLRSQMFYQLSSYMHRGIFQMREKEHDLVMNELQYFNFEKVGKDEIATKLALNSKDDIKQLLGHSPDYADALALNVEACRMWMFS